MMFDGRHTASIGCGADVGGLGAWPPCRRKIRQKGRARARRKQGSAAVEIGGPARICSERAHTQSPPASRISFAIDSAGSFQPVGGQT